MEMLLYHRDLKPIGDCATQGKEKLPTPLSLVSDRFPHCSLLDAHCCTPCSLVRVFTFNSVIYRISSKILPELHHRLVGDRINIKEKDLLQLLNCCNSKTYIRT